MSPRLVEALRVADRTFAENGLLACHAARIEIRAALAEAEAQWEDIFRAGRDSVTVGEMRERIAAEAPTVAQPVAYRIDWTEGSMGLPRFFGADERSRMENMVAFQNFPHTKVPLYAAPPQPLSPLTESKIEDCIDAANRAFNGRRQGPCGQQITTYDDWKHWLAREIERAHGIGANQPIERCQCGYPQPCSKTVPVAFCKAPLYAAPPQPVPLTDEQIADVMFAIQEDPEATKVQFARACITEFCRINGIGKEN